MVAGQAVPESLSSVDMSCIRLLFFFACCPDFGLASENGKYYIIIALKEVMLKYAT